MNIIARFKERARLLKREITAIYYAYKDPEVPLFPKILIIITIGYALSPIDLIPDFIPVLGYLDDIIILPALIALSIKLIPNNIMIQCRIRAENEPIQLKSNWFAAIIILLIWIGLTSYITYTVIKSLHK